MSETIQQSARTGARTMADPTAGQTSVAPTGRSEAPASSNAPPANLGSPAAALESARANASARAQEVFGGTNLPAGPAGPVATPHGRTEQPSELVQQGANAAPQAAPADPNALGPLSNGQFAFMEGATRRTVPMEAAVQLIQAGLTSESNAPAMAEQAQQALAMQQLQGLVGVDPVRSQQFQALVHAWNTGQAPVLPGVQAPAAAAAPDAAYTPYGAEPTAPAAAQQGDPALLAQIAQLQNTVNQLSQSSQQQLQSQAAAAEETTMRDQLALYPHLAGTDQTLLNEAMNMARARRAANSMEPMSAIVRDAASHQAELQRAVHQQLLDQHQQLGGLPPILPTGVGTPIASASTPPATRQDLMDGSIAARATQRVMAAMAAASANPLG